MSNIVNVCKVCGEEFRSEFYDGGSIQHENWSINPSNYNDSEKVDKLIRKLEMKEDNYCNIESISISLQDKFIKCALESFKRIGNEEAFNKVSDYFNKKKEKIRIIFESDEILRRYFNCYAVDTNSIIDIYEKFDLFNVEHEFYIIENIANGNYKSNLILDIKNYKFVVGNYTSFRRRLSE